MYKTFACVNLGNTSLLRTLGGQHLAMDLLKSFSFELNWNISLHLYTELFLSRRLKQSQNDDYPALLMPPLSQS